MIEGLRNIIHDEIDQNIQMELFYASHNSTSSRVFLDIIRICNIVEQRVEDEVLIQISNQLRKKFNK